MKEDPFKDNYRLSKKLSDLLKEDPEEPEKKKPVKKKAVLYVRKKSN